jgi:hypothetical protein
MEGKKKKQVKKEKCMGKVGKRVAKKEEKTKQQKK